MRMSRTIALGLLAALSIAGLARADDYPSRPIHIIVPYGPASGTDLVSRAFADAMSKDLGRPVVVENRAGANGVLGTTFVVESKPDGYTLLGGASGPLVTGPYIQNGLKFDPGKDLASVAMLAASPFVVVVPNASPVKTIQDLVSLAKASPGKITYGATGIGSSGHLAGALFEKQAGLKMQLISYTGAEAIVLDIMSGRINSYFAALPSVIGAIKSGQIRAIAMATLKPSPQLPNLPTLNDNGFPGFDTGTWVSLMAPAGTPQPVIDKLYQSVAKANATPEMAAFLARIGADQDLMDPKQLTDYLVAQRRLWSGVIADIGLGHK